MAYFPKNVSSKKADSQKKLKNSQNTVKLSVKKRKQHQDPKRLGGIELLEKSGDWLTAKSDRGETFRLHKTQWALYVSFEASKVQEVR